MKKEGERGEVLTQWLATVNEYGEHLPDRKTNNSENLAADITQEHYTFY